MLPIYNFAGLALPSRKMNIHTKCISHIFLRLMYRDQASIFSLMIHGFTWCGYILMLFKNCKIKSTSFLLGISGQRGLVFTWLLPCVKDFHFQVG